jgi:hypothetical protein
MVDFKSRLIYINDINTIVRYYPILCVDLNNPFKISAGFRPKNCDWEMYENKKDGWRKVKKNEYKNLRIEIEKEHKKWQ